MSPDAATNRLVTGGASYDANGNMTASPATLTLTLTKRYFSFGTMRFADDRLMPTGRLGSVAANGTAPADYYSYGKQVGTFEGGNPRFATYDRDTNGLDYAQNRYYSSGMVGRFLTPDPGPYDLAIPLSSNRISYSHGDPVNRNDPMGTLPMRSRGWGSEGYDENNACWICSIIFASAPSLGGPLGHDCE